MRRPAALWMFHALDEVPAASAWYQQALGAELRWDLGSVAGLDVAGAPLVARRRKPLVVVAWSVQSDLVQVEACQA